MKRNLSSTYRITIAGLMIAAGLLVPQLFHIIGGSGLGGIFLPIQIPVFLAGIFIGPLHGMIVGLLVPVVSFFITGMPTALKLPFMMVELLGYGLIVGFFKQKRMNTFLCLILAQIGGRVLYGLAIFIGEAIFKMKIPPAFTITAIITSGIPGIILQLVLIPSIVYIIRKAVPSD